MYIMHPVLYCRTDINLRQLSFLQMFLVSEAQTLKMLVWGACFAPTETNQM